jgi:hypothetical protein
MVADRRRCNKVSWAWWIQNVSMLACIYSGVCLYITLARSPKSFFTDILWCVCVYIYTTCTVVVDIWGLKGAGWRPPQIRKGGRVPNWPKKFEGCLSAYVGNLLWNVIENDLRDFFSSSKIALVRFVVDKRTRGSHGFYHVDFQDDEALEIAIVLDQSKLEGKPIKVTYSVSNWGWRVSHCQWLVPVNLCCMVFTPSVLVKLPVSL